MVFKIRHERLGDHIHCTLFCAKQRNMTYANCGNFCIDADDLPALKQAMSRVEFEERKGEAA